MTTDHELQKDIAFILAKHCGRENAIRSKKLADCFGFKGDRKIRLVIRELIANGMPIASAVQEPMGYFIIQTWEEDREYEESLKSRLIEDALRRRDFRRSVACSLLPAVQGRLL